MKNLFILTVLFICFSSFMYSQILNKKQEEKLIKPGFQKNRNENLNNPFERKGTNVFEKIQPQLKRSNKNNQVSSSVYKPIKITFDDIRETYTYDSNGNLLSEFYEKLLSPGGIWVNYKRTTYTNDNSGNRIASLSENWSDNGWVNDYRVTYTNDNSGNQLSWHREDWSSGAWGNSNRHTFTYDNSGNILTWISEDGYSGHWEGVFKYTYTYDNSGNELAYLFENWSNGTWVNNYRYTYTYDNSGNQLTNLSEKWSNGVWVNDYRYTYTYDNSGNQLTYLKKYWLYSTWVNSSRYSAVYDNSGNRLTELYENWSDSTWVNTGRCIYTYDNSGNELTYLYQTWANGIWSDYSKLEFAYDDNGNCIHAAAFWLQDTTWNPVDDLLWIYYNNKKDQLGFFVSKVDIEYTQITGVASEKINAKSFNLAQNYPNPFNPSTTIKYSIPKESFVTLKVYDVLGKEVAALVNEEKSTGNYEAHFNAANLSSGIYFYQIRAGEFVQVKKMTILK